MCHRVVSQAVVVAFGVAADGRREVLGFDVGDSENEVFWTGFLRSMKTRGLHGVKLVISDAHRAGQEMVAPIIRTVFAQPDTEHVNAQFGEVARMLGKSHPKVAQMLHDARPDVVGVFPNPAALHTMDAPSRTPSRR